MMTRLAITTGALWRAVSWAATARGCRSSRARRKALGPIMRERTARLMERGLAPTSGSLGNASAAQVIQAFAHDSRPAFERLAHLALGRHHVVLHSQGAPARTIGCTCQNLAAHRVAELDEEG